MPLSLEVLSASIDVPKELQQTPPEYVLLVESGANVHILWNQCLLAHVAERNSIISWGDSQSSACTVITMYDCYRMADVCNFL